MAPIYSQQLYNQLVIGAFAGVVYTVPVGFTVVVTDIDLFIDVDAAGRESYVLLGAAAVLYHISPAGENLQQQWVGKQVLLAGDTIAFHTTAPIAARLGITGYVLGP